MKYCVTLIGSFLAVVMINSCSFINMLDSDPYQVVEDGQGGKILKDTNGLRRSYMAAMDLHVHNEVLSHPPPGGVEGWNRFWKKHFVDIYKSQQNPDWYVNYVLCARRKVGLLEL